MSNIKVRNVPRLKLGDLLRRRKMTLKLFMDEFGITTYEALAIRCKRLGVQPPDESAFVALNMPLVSSPTEGVVVLAIEPEQDDVPRIRNGLVQLPVIEQDNLEVTEGTQKKQRKKKESLPTDE
jgi:hypothetical protein